MTSEDVSVEDGEAAGQARGLRALPRFLAEKNVRFDELQRIRWCVHVVCPLNQDRPQRVLITKRPVAKEYALCFDGVRPPRLEEVVKAVPPIVGIERKDAGRFVTYEPKSPGSAKAKNGRVVITPDHYLLGEGANFLSSAKSGRELYRTIRTRLGELCQFLPRNIDLLEAFCRLLERCACQHGLPPYATYGPLPPGLREKVTELLWSEDDSAPFDLDGIDFDRSSWSGFAGNKDGQRTLVKLAHAFRDALHERPDRQHGSLSFCTKPLDDVAREVLARDLVAGFRTAWAAVRQLRQVLRDKTLIMRILHWVVSSFYDLEQVKQHASASNHDRDRIVERLILEGVPGVVAAPVARPAEEERRRIAQMLLSAFDQLVLAVLADADQLADVCAGIPEELRPIIDAVRADPPRLRALQAMAGVNLGGSRNDQLGAFRKAWQLLILDVLCPVLFHEPVLTVDQLTQSLTERTQLAFVLALFLNDGNKKALRDLGERHRGELGNCMKGEAIEEKLRGFLTHVLEDLILVVASPKEGAEIERQLGVLVQVMPAMFRHDGGAAIPVSALVPVPSSGEVGQRQIERNIRQRVSIAAAQSATVESGNGNEKGNEKGNENGTSASGNGHRSGESGGSAKRAREVEPVIRDRLMLGGQKGCDAGQLVTIVTEDLCTSTEEDAVAFRTNVSDELGLWGSVLRLVFERYHQNRDKRGFVGQVDRLVLEALMLQDQASLGLGDVSAALFMLLTDLVAHLDANNPDPKAFLRDHSLLEYFTAEQLKGGGVTELRQTLETNGLSGLENLLRFVGEVLGLDALLKVLEQHGGELVLHNVTSSEYLDLLEADNLAENASAARGLLRPDALADPRRERGQTTVPVMTYFTDTAFPEGGPSRLEFLQRLAQMRLRSKVGRVVLPPICLSTGPMDADGAWVKTGRELAAAAERVPAPVLIVGPSPWCRSRDGSDLPTYVPAGYRVCAWLLGERDETSVLRNVPDESHGRFRVIGHGCPTLGESLDLALHGRGAGDHSFGADIWLYHQLLILAAAAARAGGNVPAASPYFGWFRESEFEQRDYDATAAVLAPVLIDPAWRFSFGEDIARGAKLSTVRCQKRSSNGDSRYLVASFYQWFNLARERLGL